MRHVAPLIGESNFSRMGQRFESFVAPKSLHNTSVLLCAVYQTLSQAETQDHSDSFTMPETPHTAPRRMFIKEILSSHPHYVRVMACLVTIRSHMLKLDDGTGILSVKSELPIKGAVGQTLDVLVRRSQESYHAETIIWNVEPKNEILRNLELTYTGERHLGYPCPPVSEREVMRMISHGEGATLEDLSLVLDVSEQRMQEILHELQLIGEIYCNRQGAYVPL
jgi:hypothetical protein